MTEETLKRTDEKARTKRAAKAVQPGSAEVSKTSFIIGNKFLINHFLACTTHLNSGANNVALDPRGWAAPRTEDTIEVLRPSFAKSVQLEGISLSTEELERDKGRRSRVSAVEISLTKPYRRLLYQHILMLI